MTDFPGYTVAIRTLGLSGEKFRQTVLSLKKQTVPPSAINIYIAEGYSLPERVADEVYIYCPKGMVAQRALSFDEITTDLILFSDDDMLYAPDSVERLLCGMIEMGGDCISANVFPNHLWDLKHKVVQAFFYGIVPSFSMQYAFTIRNNGSYRYCLHPREVMKSQSCAGAVIMVKKKALLGIRFYEELWMDSFRYALGDDQLFGYKFFCSNYVLLIHYDTGVVHLDARSGSVKDLKEADYFQRMLKYIIWHRSIYEPANIFKRVVSLISFYLAWAKSFIWSLFKILWGDHEKIKTVICSLKDAKAYVKSSSFKSIPKWPR